MMQQPFVKMIQKAKIDFGIICHAHNCTVRFFQKKLNESKYFSIHTPKINLRIWKFAKSYMILPIGIKRDLAIFLLQEWKLAVSNVRCHQSVVRKIREAVKSNTNAYKQSYDEWFIPLDLTLNHDPYHQPPIHKKKREGESHIHRYMLY